MIALDGDDVEVAYLGLPRTETRALQADESVRLSAEILRARSVVFACVAVLVLGIVVVAADVLWHVETVGVCGLIGIAVLLGPGALGVGWSAFAQTRRLEADLGAGTVDVFRGELGSPTGDAAAQHLMRAGRFREALDARAAGRSVPVEIELTSSGLPLPRGNEKLSRVLAHPSRIARPPASLAALGKSRRMTSSERMELARHAVQLRRWTLAEGAVVAWGAMAIGSLVSGAGLGSGLTQTRALIATVIAVVAMTRVVSRRREARDLERAEEVSGEPQGESLPNGAPWTIAGEPAPWRRA